MSEGDLLKIKLQLLQFQTDLSTANLAKVQALAALRQFVGFESVPDEFDVDGDLDYQPVHADIEALKLLAMQNRPDLRAAQEGVTAARSQESLCAANGKTRCRRHLRLHPHRRHQQRSLFLQHRSPDFRPQPGRNRPHPLRHHPVSSNKLWRARSK